MKNDLLNTLRTYRAYNEAENKMLLDTIDFLEKNEIYLGKKNLEGHITGSAWIINKEGTKCFLTHHKKLNIWVQLGGHTEEEESVQVSAYREAIEESGFKNLRQLSHTIYDVDVHLIPERKGLPAHYHYDIRYAFIADENEMFQISDESHDLKWVDLKDIDKYSKDPSILRMVEKMEGLCLKN